MLEPADLDAKTEPFAARLDARIVRARSPDDEIAHAALYAQLGQQLTHADLALDPLPRTRAPHSTVEIDDEITNIVARPSPRP